MKTRIALAEDNHFLAKSMEEKLSFFDDLEFRFTAVNGTDMLKKLESDHNIDVILMDIQMPEMDGITTTEKVKQRYPQISVIMLTVFEDEDNIFRSIQAGANGYLLKDETPENIHNGIHEILAGGAPMSSQVAIKALTLLRDPASTKAVTAPTEDFQLTDREVEILEHLSQGLSYQLIADNLFISIGTVRKHIENTYRKLEVHNKVEAIQMARKHRIV